MASELRGVAAFAPHTRTLVSLARFRFHCRRSALRINGVR